MNIQTRADDSQLRLLDMVRNYVPYIFNISLVMSKIMGLIIEDNGVYSLVCARACVRDLYINFLIFLPYQSV